MRKISILMLLCLAFFGVARAEVVEIGDQGVTTNNSYLPGYNYYNYSLSQQIYTAEQIGMAGTINSVAFKNTGAEKTRTYNVYMLLTDKETFTSGTDWVAMSSDDLVFAGSVTFAVGEWTTIELDTPFAYDGASNLLIGVADVSGAYTPSPHMACLVFDATSQSISAYRDTPGAYDITAPGVTGTVRNVKNQIQLDITPSGAVVCYKPSITVSNITHNQATLNWSGGSGVYDAAWRVASPTPTDWYPIITNDPTSTSFVLTGLEPLTAYEARVRSVCEGGVTSDWKEVSFTTTAPAEEVGNGWSDNFDANLSWELINGTCTNAWAHGNAANNGGQALYISNDGGTSNAYTVSSAAMVYATKLLHFNEGKYEFTYDWMAYGESTWDFLRVLLVPASVTLSAGTTLPSGLGASATPSTWIALDGGSKLNLVTEWQNKSVAVNVPAGNYYLVMAWRDDTSGGTQPPAAVDNVSITPVTCAYDVEGLALGNITTNSATLTWTAGEATQWQVAYSTRSTFENAEYQIVSAATYEMTGLQSNTEYYAKVRAYCGGEDYGSWSDVISFTTACEALTTYPYTENFDSYTATSGFLPDCWDRINTGTSYSTYPYIITSNAHSTSNCLYFYSYGSSSSTTISDQYAILPPMENLAGKQITLFAKGYNNQSTFKIGTMTDPTNVTTFTEIATQELTTTYQEFIYDVPATATGNYIAILMERPDASSSVTRGVYIDDITIDFPPTCIKPTGLTASNVTRNSVTLSWNADEGQDLWEIGYKTDEDEDYYWFVESTENPYVLTGDPTRPLAPLTHYTVKVRANCGDGDYSDWSTETSFTTLIACATPTGLAASEVSPNSAKLNWYGNNEGYNVMYRTAAYSEGLYEEFNTSSLPSTWTQYTGLVNDVLEGGTLTTATSYKWGTNSYALGAYNAKLNIYGANVKTWLVTPEFYLGERQTLEFDLALTDYNNADPIEDPTAQDDDRFVVLINLGGISSGGGWIPLREWNNTGSDYVYNNIATAGEHVSIDLSNFDMGIVQIAFYGESTVNGNGDNDLHIDNVSIGLYHNAGPWQTVTVSDTTMVVLNQLASETRYEAKVQGDCNEFGTSNESSMISFTTLMECPSPMDIEVSNLLHTSATLSWTGYSDTYNIEYCWYEALPAFSSFDFEDGVIPQGWDTTTSNYPWAIVAENGGYYIQSTNQGVSSSTSTITTTAHYSGWGYISFDAKCMGEGTSFDVCKFFIDDELKLSKGANGDFWDTYTFEVTPGEHTFTWSYTKDSSVNPTGDAFSVDNVSMYLRNLQWGTPITDITGTTYEFIGLIPNTPYTAFINADCDPDAVSEASFTTLSLNHKVFVDENGIWSDAESWRPSGAPTLTQTAELRANVTIPSGCVAEANRIIFTGTPAPTLTIADGAQLKTNTTVKATVKKNIAGYGTDNVNTDNGYVMLTTPMTSSHTAASAGLVNDTVPYDLYNWSRTATDAEWHNSKQSSSFYMYNGTGYLYANQNDVVLSFTGNIRANGTDYTVTPGYDATVGGWNLYGNPFVCDAYLTSDTVAMAFYTLSGNTFVATTGPVASMEGFFAQTPASGKTITVTRTVPAKQGQLNLSVNQGSSLKDNAIIRFGEGNTLKKLSFFENSSKLFITMEGEDYAVVNADKSGEMPISFKTEEEGSYTLLFSNEEVNFSTLRLIDTLTGEEVNLLETPSYTFEAKAGDNANRFKLVYVTK